MKEGMLCTVESRTCKPSYMQQDVYGDLLTAISYSEAEKSYRKIPVVVAATETKWPISQSIT